MKVKIVFVFIALVFMVSCSTPVEKRISFYKKSGKEIITSSDESKSPFQYVIYQDQSGVFWDNLELVREVFIFDKKYPTWKYVPYLGLGQERPGYYIIDAETDPDHGEYFYASELETYDISDVEVINDWAIKFNNCVVMFDRTGEKHIIPSRSHVTTDTNGYKHLFIKMEGLLSEFGMPFNKQRGTSNAKSYVSEDFQNDLKIINDVDQYSTFAELTDDGSIDCNTFEEFSFNYAGSYSVDQMINDRDHNLLIKIYETLYDKHYKKKCIGYFDLLRAYEANPIKAAQMYEGKKVFLEITLRDICEDTYYKRGKYLLTAELNRFKFSEVTHIYIWTNDDNFAKYDYPCTTYIEAYNAGRDIDEWGWKRLYLYDATMY